MALTLPTFSLPSLPTLIDRLPSISATFIGREVQPYNTWAPCAASIMAGAVGSIATGSSGPFVTGLSLCGVSGVAAQMPIGNEFQVSNRTQGPQQNPALADLGNGRFVVAYQHDFFGARDTDTLYQTFDPRGTRIGPERVANNYSDSHQREPAITRFTDYSFTIVWASHAQDGDVYGVYGQDFFPNGTKHGPEFQVNTYTPSDQRNPAIASFANGNFVVVWESQGQDGDGKGIFGQLFSRNTTKIGSEFPVSTFTSRNQAFPTVTALSTGGFVASWSTPDFVDATSEVLGQLFDSSGNKIVGEFRINTFTSSEQARSSTIALDNGNFLATWQSHTQDGSIYGIYAQLFSSSAAKIGSEFRVNTYTALDQTLPAAARLTDNYIAITWISEGQDGDGRGIFAQLLNATGGLVGPEFQVNSYTMNDQVSPAITGFGQNFFAIAWNSFGQDGDVDGVYAQIFFNNISAPFTTGTTGSTGTTATTGSTDTTATTRAIQTTGTTAFVNPTSTTAAPIASAGSSPTKADLTWLWVILGVTGVIAVGGGGTYLVLRSRNHRTPVEVDYDGSSGTEEIVVQGDSDEIGHYHNTQLPQS